MPPQFPLQTPQILFSRPTQIGIPGESYWTAGGWPEFPHASLSVASFRDGADIKGVAFEVDTAGGWVGIYAHDVTDGRVTLRADEGGEPLMRWLVGTIRLGEPSAPCRPAGLSQHAVAT